jgi:DNA repair exonuclease SbcCD nuclease subunit
MTSFLFITDTHLGAAPMQFQQQKGYPEKLHNIVDALKKFIENHGKIDFILHGGDMIDFTSEENIINASETFKFSVPLYLCLGNHDLTTKNAVSRWMSLAPQFFINNEPSSTLKNEDCVIHITPNHWEETPFYWSKQQNPYLSGIQKYNLHNALITDTDLPHMILTHNPVFGLSTEQTGFADPYHAPEISFTSEINSFVSKHKNVKSVLGGHNHLNMRHNHNHVEYITASSLVESPFEFKLFEVSSNNLTMKTINLAQSIDFDSVYDEQKSYVQGRPVDRTFEVTFKT